MMASIQATDLVPPSAEKLERIFKDLNLNVNQLESDTKTLRDWLLTQPHLPHDLEDKMLTSFIVGCENSLEHSKKMLDVYLTNRTSCPEFYASRDPCDETFRRIGKLIRYFVLPDMTPEGYRVSVYGMSSGDISNNDFDLRINAIRVLSSFDTRLLEENYWNGDIIILDCRHASIRHIPSVLNLPILKKYVHCVNQSLPVVYQKIIFINLSPLLEPIITLVKSILKQTFVQRTITTTKDYPFLYDHVPRDILPDEFGGKAGKIEDLNDAWQLKIESQRDWFLKDMARTVDESKRPKKKSKNQKK